MAEMAKEFQAAAAYLEGTDFGTMLLEMGRLNVPNEPKDPQEAFIVRANLFADQLEKEVRGRGEKVLEQDPRPLRTLGMLRNFLRMKDREWRAKLPHVLRGFARFEADSPSKDRETDRLAA